MILPSFQRFHIQLKSGKLSNQNLIRSYPIHCSACLHMYIMHLHITAYIILYTNANTSLSLSLSPSCTYIIVYLYIYMWFYIIRYICIYNYGDSWIYFYNSWCSQPAMASRANAALGFPARAARLLARRMPRPRSASPDSAAPGRPPWDVRCPRKGPQTAPVEIAW